MVIDEIRYIHEGLYPEIGEKPTLDHIGNLHQSLPETLDGLHEFEALGLDIIIGEIGRSQDPIEEFSVRLEIIRAYIAKSSVGEVAYASLTLYLSQFEYDVDFMLTMSRLENTLVYIATQMRLEMNLSEREINSAIGNLLDDYLQFFRTNHQDLLAGLQDYMPFDFTELVGGGESEQELLNTPQPSDTINEFKAKFALRYGFPCPLYLKPYALLVLANCEGEFMFTDITITLKDQGFISHAIDLMHDRILTSDEVVLKALEQFVRFGLLVPLPKIDSNAIQTYRLATNNEIMLLRGLPIDGSNLTQGLKNLLKRNDYFSLVAVARDVQNLGRINGIGAYTITKIREELKRNGLL